MAATPFPPAGRCRSALGHCCTAESFLLGRSYGMLDACKVLFLGGKVIARLIAAPGRAFSATWFSSLRLLEARAQPPALPLVRAALGQNPQSARPLRRRRLSENQAASGRGREGGREEAEPGPEPVPRGVAHTRAHGDAAVLGAAHCPPKEKSLSRSELQTLNYGQCDGRLRPAKPTQGCREEPRAVHEGGRGSGTPRSRAPAPGTRGRDDADSGLPLRLTSVAGGPRGGWALAAGVQGSLRCS